VQTTGLLPTHVPDWQLSVWVQLFPSLHVVPFAAIGLEHCPVCGLHVPATWHASDAAQTTGLLPTHVPDWHVSACVQLFPSLHEVPFAATGFEHWPVCGLHVPATWHWSEAPQMTGFAPLHAPAWHVSVCVQLFPSLHALPFGAAGFEHCPVCGLQTPAT